MYAIIEERREGRMNSHLTSIYTMISNFLSAVRREINMLAKKFPVLPTWNRFFYILHLAKNNIFSTFFVIMLFFASFFNLADANGKFSAMTIAAIQQGVGNSYTEVSLRSFQGQIAKEAMYDSIGNGRGGISEEQIDEYAYPTTADDAL